MPEHRGGAATKQTAPRRRNPKGAWGLRPHTASLVVGDGPASLSSSLLVCNPQAPCARPGRILGQAPSAGMEPARWRARLIPLEMTAARCAGSCLRGLTHAAGLVDG